MECHGSGLLEDILRMAPRSSIINPWDAIRDLPLKMDPNELLGNDGWRSDCFKESQAPDSCFVASFSPSPEDYNGYHPIAPADSSRSNSQENFSTVFRAREENLPFFSVAKEEEGIAALPDDVQPMGTSKSEFAISQESRGASPLIFVATEGRKGRVKKPDGQFSKNLMAERRRRKRVNDRLSMLRSIVPKISRMDRTSILGDTIDYMKELLEKITNLQHEMGFDPHLPYALDILKDMKANDMFVRNTPKFEVERRNGETSIEMCCADRPGLLLSTLNTIETSGVEIQHCVISCFSDFALQASCSDGMDQRKIVGTAELKQALFRNAGYGGKCQ